ncbi:MAG: zf-TFIIB domain-containing protein [Candidatus Woesearchaeota archaeon]|jgi:hypothetical protein
MVKANLEKTRKKIVNIKKNNKTITCNKCHDCTDCNDKNDKNNNSKNNDDNKSKEKNIYCPKCSGLFTKIKMRKLKHPTGAILDVCDKCEGMFIDAPEIKLLNNYKESVRRSKK